MIFRFRLLFVCYLNFLICFWSPSKRYAIFAFLNTYVLIFLEFRIGKFCGWAKKWADEKILLTQNQNAIFNWLDEASEVKSLLKEGKDYRRRIAGENWRFWIWIKNQKILQTILIFSPHIFKVPYCNCDIFLNISF